MSKSHWETIYKTKPSDQVSWHISHLDTSLEMIRALKLPKDASILDIGGGASTLPDDLIADGFQKITVLDISTEAIRVSQKRLGEKAARIRWIEADITRAPLEENHYRLCHDRAVFHFLTSPVERKKYVDILKKSLLPGGYVIMATFGPNGPQKCSGLEIVRYSPESLSKELGGSFKMEKQTVEIHKTPFNTEQEFIYCLFKKEF